MHIFKSIFTTHSEHLQLFWSLTVNMKNKEEWEGNYFSWLRCPYLFFPHRIGIKNGSEVFWERGKEWERCRYIWLKFVLQKYTICFKNQMIFIYNNQFHMCSFFLWLKLSIFEIHFKMTHGIKMMALLPNVAFPYLQQLKRNLQDMIAYNLDI